MPRRRHQKRKKEEPMAKEFKVPSDLTSTAKQYYNKYQALDKPKSSIGYSGGYGGSYAGGGSYKSKTQTTHGGYSYTKKDCTHWRTPLELAEGITIHACAYRDHPKKDWHYPQMGVYFASSWDDFSRATRDVFTSTWKGPKPKAEKSKEVEAEICVLDWPDFNVPRASKEYIIKLFEYILNSAGNGKNVEIGCIGGHGRTGTAIAAMLIMLGEVDAGKAMKWVWENYCIHAIESSSQEDWLWSFAEHIYGEEAKKAKKRYDNKKKKKEATPLVKGLKETNKKGGTASTFDHKEEDKFWFNAAISEYNLLIKGGMEPDDAITFLALTYGFEEDDIVAALEAEEDGITATEIDKVLDEYSLANEQANREAKPGGLVCGLCQKLISTCHCFDGAGVSV